MLVYILFIEVWGNLCIYISVLFIDLGLIWIIQYVFPHMLQFLYEDEFKSVYTHLYTFCRDLTETIYNGAKEFIQMLDAYKGS